jgi:hypothetical protein
MENPIEIKLGTYTLRVYEDLTVTKYKKKSTRLPEMWVPINFSKQEKINKNGNIITYYRFELKINGKRIKIRRHRLIYYAHNQDWDIFDSSMNNSIDHINGTESGDYIHNLRLVTHQQNHFNRQNAKGYCWDKKKKKFMAQIFIDGKNIAIRCNSEEEAIEARKQLKIKYHKI